MGWSWSALSPRAVNLVNRAGGNAADKIFRLPTASFSDFVVYSQAKHSPSACAYNPLAERYYLL